ncbi:MAG: glycine zipper family protein [Gammaproteobacteria bacterium]
MRFLKHSLTLVAALGLSACATYPTGPSRMALPGTASSFDQFQFDDVQCRNYAAQQSGAQSAQQAAEKSAVDSAAVGTAVGAAAGALIGAASGDAGAGAAIGAGSGLLLGAAGGSDAYSTGGYRMQDRYDNAYIQCMYARGHQVPVPASVAAAYQAQPSPNVVAPAPSSNTPPPGSAPAAPSAYPPPGTPPPPGY